MHRAVCRHCRKAEVMCYCAQLKPFKSCPEFIILIHPKETRKAINTGRMAHLMIENCHLLVGCDFTEDQKLNRLLADPTRRCVLLFPGPQSLDIESFQQREGETDQRLLTFIILDGTWAMAKKMYRLSPNLQALPQVMFHPSRPSRFSIRQQPDSHCYATIETVHHMIEVLGTHPAGEHHRLLDLFEDMVKKQIDYEERNQVECLSGAGKAEPDWRGGL